VHTSENAPIATTERRRTPRFPLPDAAEAQIVSGTSVQVLDISVGGVLLLSSRSAAVGTRGRLSVTVADNPLATEIEIRRVSELPNRPGYRIGAMFIDLSPEHRAAITRFTGQA
jgi:hypothetical protein